MSILKRSVWYFSRP